MKMSQEFVAYMGIACTRLALLRQHSLPTRWKRK
jgi:hypothetical protein